MDNRTADDESLEVYAGLGPTGDWEDDSRLCELEDDSEEEDEAAVDQKIVLSHEYM